MPVGRPRIRSALHSHTHRFKTLHRLEEEDCVVLFNSLQSSSISLSKFDKILSTHNQLYYNLWTTVSTNNNIIIILVYYYIMYVPSWGSLLRILAQIIEACRLVKSCSECSDNCFMTGNRTPENCITVCIFL